MATAMSKRTQARNEKALQELIKVVPGNDRCADCGARNPGTFSAASSEIYLLTLASQVGQAGVYVFDLLYISVDLQCAEILDRAARYIPVHAVRLPSPQARYAHIEGEVIEYG